MKRTVLFFFPQRVHHVAVPGGDVHRALHLSGGLQPADLPADTEGQRGAGAAVAAAAEGDPAGHHAHDGRHRLLHVQCPGVGHQCPRGESSINSNINNSDNNDSNNNIA